MTERETILTKPDMLIQNTGRPWEMDGSRNMISTIICGLSDVLIPSLRAADGSRAGRSQADSPNTPAIPPGASRAGDVILERLVAEDLRGLRLGEMTERQFCHRLLDRAGWPTDIEHLRTTIQMRFSKRVSGSAEVLRLLKGRCRLVLIADHAREWVDEIRALHPELLAMFDREFFSFDLHRLKSDPGTFRMALGLLGEAPSDCLVIDAEPSTVTAAAETGIEGIVFKNAEQLAKELQKRGLTPESSTSSGE